MLIWLKAQDRGSGASLLRKWNSLMEDLKDRAEFFETVVKTAKIVDYLSLASYLKTQCLSTDGNVEAGQKWGRGTRQALRSIHEDSH
jgi:hypothetical protein